MPASARWYLPAELITGEREHLESAIVIAAIERLGALHTAA
jgi:hypothetical protein